MTATYLSPSPARKARAVKLARQNDGFSKTAPMQ